MSHVPAPFLSSPPPESWGASPLTEFFEIARQNAFASFTALRDDYERLAAVDHGLLDFLTAWRDPEDAIAATLIIRAHSALRAAIQLALSGQIPEAVALCRASLESFLYSVHIARSEPAREAWMRRHDDPAGKKACREAFSMQKIWGSLAQVDCELVPIAQGLYEQSIDQGAHPNVHGVFGTVTIEETEEATTVDSAYISGEVLAVRFGLRSCAQVGIAGLRIVAALFSTRAELLDIPARAVRLSQGL